MDKLSIKYSNILVIIFGVWIFILFFFAYYFNNIYYFTLVEYAVIVLFNIFFLYMIKQIFLRKVKDKKTFLTTVIVVIFLFLGISAYELFRLEKRRNHDGFFFVQKGDILKLKKSDIDMNNVNMRSHFKNETLLMRSIKAERRDIVLYLMKLSASINLKDIEGKTAYEYCLEASHKFKNRFDCTKIKP